MRYIIIILLLLQGCSANWHLQRALQKNSDIIDTEADTSVSKNIEYRDTTFTIQTDTNIQILSDTIQTTDTLIMDGIRLVDTTLYKFSEDSISQTKLRLQLSQDTTIINLDVWSIMDTNVVVTDTVFTVLKIPTFNKYITKANEAKITKEKTFIDKITNLAIIIGIIAFIVVIGIVVLKFR